MCIESTILSHKEKIIMVKKLSKTKNRELAEKIYEGIKDDVADRFIQEIETVLDEVQECDTIYTSIDWNDWLMENDLCYELGVIFDEYMHENFTYRVELKLKN